jgi:hypothetical protein
LRIAGMLEDLQLLNRRRSTGRLQKYESP